MSDRPAASNGALKWPPQAVPTWVVVISFVVAVGSVSVLLLILFNRTTGPGEVLREYYRAVNAGDCDSSYELLADPVKSQTPKDAYCTEVAPLKGEFPPDFKIESIKLLGEEVSAETAEVVIQEPDSDASVAWDLTKEGDTWFISSLGPITSPGESIKPST